MSMTVSERIQALRQLMTQYKWDAAVISGTDPHASEYLPERWQQRQWISGFTGSYGTVVVTATHAGLWTDTRYFIQSAKELAGTGIELHKLRVPDAVDYPAWLAANLPTNAVVGIDGLCMSLAATRELAMALNNSGGRIDNRPDYLEAIWENRPQLPLNPLFLLDTMYAGRSAQEKITWLRALMDKEKCTHFILNSLDQIAWLFNIRCQDVSFNPVAISYAIIDAQNATLFIQPQKVGQTVHKLLAEQGIQTAPYAQFIGQLAQLPTESRVWIDGTCMNFAVYNALRTQLGNQIVDKTSPILLEKALKNPVEVEGFRQASLKDGVALTRFFRWLEHTVNADIAVSELDAAAKLSELRARSDGSMGDSFHYISAYGQNAALPHYFPTKEQFSYLEKKGLYLIDSGGQYLHGTTDITRTVPLGPLTDLEREDYTLVLKGMIALCTAVFVKGTNGTNLDILPRLPLWKAYRNYGHGTGHGIGHYLCVHEGPQDIRLAWRDQPILPGMVTSDEPGMYREGMHGVRHENVILCVPATEAGADGINVFGEWLQFETLTLCYIDSTPLIKELMEPSEIDWLNNYNSHVYQMLSPYLNEDEVQWLEGKTRPI